jgi:aspartate racemase
LAVSWLTATSSINLFANLLDANLSRAENPRTLSWHRNTSMKHIGIVAVSTEGAALCYRTICLEGAALLGPHAHPEISLHNFSLGAYQRLIDRDDWYAVGDMLLASANKLVRAGAELLICPDNTIHQGLDLVRHESPAPWIHIAEEVTKEAQGRGFKCVGILGTRFLMEGPVYPSRLAPAGIEHRVPNPSQRQRINQIIYDELVCARLLPPSLAYFQEVIRALASEGCDAVALACTEIPLLINDANSALPILDSTRIIARSALRAATL